MIIGFNPNYPALHISEALASIETGDHSWDAEEVQSIITQADTLISEREKSLTQYEISKLNALLALVKEAA